MKAYNKLVRDKIPDIIRQGGETPHMCVLEDTEYRRRLEMKLDEEVNEYHADKNLEELADILEVIYALADVMGHSRQTLMDVYQKKHEARGGFEKRLFLIGKE